MSWKFNPFTKKPDYYETSSAGSVDDVARDNIVNLAWRLAIAEGLSVFNLEDGVVDEFEDETGVDTTASTNESYDSTDDYYSPSGGAVVDNMEYASDALAQAAYVSNSSAHLQSYSESTIKTQGSYALKAVAVITGSLNKTLTRAVSPVNEGTGGTITHVGGYTIHTFTSSGTFNPGKVRDVEYLVVAGGGAGGGAAESGYNGAGGGGGGGVLSGTDTSLPASNYTITVGGGGVGDGGKGTNGGNSEFNSHTATGGGAGGASYEAVGENGGSGGGGCSTASPAAGGTGVAGPPRQGYNGGRGSATAPNYSGGGGGGASANGVNATSTVGGNGGAGVASSISGSSVTYGGGGGGGTYNGGTPGTGGAGGGGNGGTGGSCSAGTANTGGGGGGTGGGSGAGNGGNGGSGIVIVRYKTAYIDLTDINSIKFDIRSSRTGSNIKIGLHDTGGTTTEITPNITVADTFQTVTWDISGVTNANKDAIDSVIITIVNADSANTFYIDAFAGPMGNMTLISESVEAEEQPTEARFLALVEPVDTITVNTDLKAYVSEDDGSNYDEVTLTDEGYFDSTKKILAGNVTLTDRSDKTMVQKLETANSKDLKVHAWGMLWK